MVDLGNLFDDERDGARCANDTVDGADADDVDNAKDKPVK